MPTWFRELCESHANGIRAARYASYRSFYDSSHPQGIVIRRWGLGLVLVAGSVLPAASASAATPEGPPALTSRLMPPSIKADCSVADSTAILSNWLNGLPSGSSVQFLTIANNTGLQGAIPIWGGSITTPFAGSAMSIDAVVNANIRANIFPMFDGTPDYFPDTPYVAVLQALEIKNLTMTGSNFSGALGILHPTSQANTNVAERGNLYGANGAQIDSS
jgi:hypothetical protein